MTLTQPVKGLFFDVFGTCVDWRGTVTRGLYDAAQKALRDDAASIASSVRSRASEMSSEWGIFAQEWRSSYYAFTNSVVSGKIGEWKTVDEHHHDSLLELLEEYGLTGLWSKEQVRDLSLVWHRLDPWSDSVQGMAEMNKNFETCTLSNGNLTLLDDLKSHSGIAFKHVLSAEMFQSYKPAPAVYLGAAKKIGLEPNECAMVAAHLSDLKAAKALGFAAVYVWRPQEEAMSATDIEEARKAGWVDIWIEEGQNGFVTAAQRLHPSH